MNSNVIQFPATPMAIRALKDSHMMDEIISTPMMQNMELTIRFVMDEYGYFDREHTPLTLTMLESGFLPEEISLFLPYE